MTGIRGKSGNRIVAEVARPALIGVLFSCVITAGLIAAFSLLFVLLETITESAVVPLALLSAACGCFAGAFLCAYLAKCRGVFFGAAIGVIMFLLICLVGLMGKDGLFGTETVIKLIMLLVSGCAGGYIGSGCGRRKRK